MRFSVAIDLFIEEMQRRGRINSEPTERSYRDRLDKHAEDVGNRDPRKTGRADVKTTLRRWPRANTQYVAHAILASFYDWAMTDLEPPRRDNPARQVARAKRTKTAVYRLTRQEVVAILDASQADRRERYVAHLGACAGLRNAELRGVQGRHFRRPGFLWVSADIAKGGRERWVPVIPDLQAVWWEIAETVGDGEYAVPSRQIMNPPRNTIWREDLDKPTSGRRIWEMADRIAKRAGIAAHIHPHLLRHAFGDHIAKRAGLMAAQEMLGHESVETTETYYTGRLGLDELAAAVAGVTFREPAKPLPLQRPPETPDKATTGIEPVYTALQAAA